MNFEIVDITPDMAKKYLEMSVGNRNIRDLKVDQYADDMIHNRWLVTGDAISFNVRGELVQGHHRLCACIKAGVSFRTAVLWGVAPNAAVAMDVGAGRTLADILHNAGESSVTQLAAIINSSWRWENGFQTHLGKVPSRQVALNWLEANPDVRDIIPLVSRVSSAPIKFRASISGPLFYRGLLMEPDLIEDFVSEIQWGSPEQKSGTHLLREILIREGGTKHSPISPVKLMAFSIKAWNLWVREGSASIIKWSQIGRGREQFPVMVNSKGESFEEVRNVCEG